MSTSFQLCPLPHSLTTLVPWGLVDKTSLKVKISRQQNTTLAKAEWELTKGKEAGSVDSDPDFVS